MISSAGVFTFLERVDYYGMKRGETHGMLSQTLLCRPRATGSNLFPPSKVPLVELLMINRAAGLIIKVSFQAASQKHARPRGGDRLNQSCSYIRLTLSPLNPSISSPTIRVPPPGWLCDLSSRSFIRERARTHTHAIKNFQHVNTLTVAFDDMC